MDERSIKTGQEELVSDRCSVPFSIKIGRHDYVITTEDRFMDNGALVQLLTQSKVLKNYHYVNPVLTKRVINQISKMPHKYHRHGYDSSVVIFSVEPSK